MAGQEGSSEEFVEDDSGEEEEEGEEDGDSSASFESEEDEEASDGDESDAFETPQKARKRAKVAQSSPSTAGAAGKKPASTAALKNPASKPAAKAAPASATKKRDAGATAGAGATAKGKGRAKSSEALPSPRGTIPSTPGRGGGGDRVSGSPASSKVGSTAPSGIGGAPSAAAPASSTPTMAASTAKGGGGGAAGAASVAKTPKAAVADYMQKSNRPYSCINVFDNLHKKIPKAMVQKLLDELTQGGKLKMQEYGKSKIYFPNQDALPNGAGEVSDKKLQGLEKDAKKLTSQLEVASAQAREAQSRFQALSSQPTDEALEKNLASTALEVEQMEGRNAAIKGMGHSAVAGGMKAAKKDYNKFRSLWVNRKRNAMDVVDMIADGMEKKTSAIMEMIGLEADQEPIPPRT